MIKSPSQRTSEDYSPEELLILLIYIYSVAGEFSLDGDLREAEERVKTALAHVFSEESQLSPLLQKITGECKHHCRPQILCIQKPGFWVETVTREEGAISSHRQGQPVSPIVSFSSSGGGIGLLSPSQNLYLVVSKPWSNSKILREKLFCKVLDSVLGLEIAIFRSLLFLSLQYFVGILIN